MIFISCINTACNLSNETREPRKKRWQTKRGLPFGKKWWNPWKGSKWHTGWATNWNDTGETLMIDKYKSYKSIPFYPGSKRWLNCLPRRVTFSQDTLHPCPWSLSQRVSPHRIGNPNNSLQYKQLLLIRQDLREDEFYFWASSGGNIRERRQKYHFGNDHSQTDRWLALCLISIDIISHCRDHIT